MNKRSYGIKKIGVVNRAFNIHLLCPILNTFERKAKLFSGKNIMFTNDRGYGFGLLFSSVQSLSRVQLFVTPWTAARQASLSIANSWSLLKLMSIESVMPSKPSHPLSSLSPPAFNLSKHQGLFQWVSSSHQVAKVLEIQPRYGSNQILSIDEWLRNMWYICMNITQS